MYQKILQTLQRQRVDLSFSDLALHKPIAYPLLLVLRDWQGWRTDGNVQIVLEQLLSKT
jgi:hypothetical protein